MVIESFRSLSESPGLEFAFRVVCDEPLVLVSSVLKRALGSNTGLLLVGAGAAASSCAACQVPGVGFSNISNFFLMLETLLDTLVGAVTGLEVSGESSLNSVVEVVLVSTVEGLLIIIGGGVGIGGLLVMLDMEAFLETVAILDTDAFLDMVITEGLLTSFDVEAIEGLLDSLDAEDVLELDDAEGLLPSIDAREGLRESADETLLAFAEVDMASTPATLAGSVMGVTSFGWISPVR